MKKFRSPKYHDCAHLHVSGQSEYVDDRPLHKNEVFLDIFYSTRAHASIDQLDYSAALKMPGVIAIYTAKDFYHNRWGTIFKDQPLLADKEVQFAGEPIAIVVAKTFEQAQYAKKSISINYTNLPKIMSIQEAIDKKSFIAESRSITKGDCKEVFKSQKIFVIEDELKIAGADHFYLESQATIAYPLEDGQIEVHSSAQHPTETQHVVAHALGLPESYVVCQVKRMGGGFGGKESQAAPFAAMAALAAQKLNRPARIILTKDDDMIMTGKRNPFHIFFKVAFDKTGKLRALQSRLYSDAGAYADLSTSIMERAMLHSDNAYYIPNMDVIGQVCKTNHHPHTAFRGFGGPKGVAAIELIIEKIAHYLKIDAFTIRERNLYQVNHSNETHYGQVLKNNCLPTLFEQIKKKISYEKKRATLNEFNSSSKQFIKGLCVTPVKFGISFTTRFLNQANALVIIHQDGSLQVSTGATEMGQGVNARIATIVTSELGLPREAAKLMPTRTDKNANTSPTAASSGTDLNGAAALLATRRIKHRLSEFAAQLLQTPVEQWASKTAGLGTAEEIKISSEYSFDTNDPNSKADWNSGLATFFEIEFQDEFVFHKKRPKEKIKFQELVLEAYLNRISLCDYAHYKIPGIEFDKLAGKGDAFLYFSQGVASSMVSVNKDTGEVKVDEVSILMDLGRSIEKELDLGQISGAFIQGMGWVTAENLVYNEEGLLLSCAPSTYKIPNIQDTPRKFEFDLIRNEENYMNVRGTKAVGEPPLLLALSIWGAIQNALSYLPAFKDTRVHPSLSIPATNENILRQIYPEQFEKYQ